MTEGIDTVFENVYNTGYESNKYKITNISHNHKNSHKITITYINSQKITKKLQKFCNLLWFLWFFVNSCDYVKYL